MPSKFTAVAIIIFGLAAQVAADWTAIAAYKKTEKTRNKRRIVPVTETCQAEGLSVTQKELCLSYPKEMVFLETGVNLGVKSCEKLLENSMWNCPNKATKKSIKFMGKKNTKEIGFSSALLAAAGMAVLHDACRRGDITNCQCSFTKTGMQQCKLDAAVTYGYEFSKGFIDVEQYETALDMISEQEKSQRRRDALAKKKERRAMEEKLLKLYNAELGRFLARKSSKLDCKCYGVSGSCSQKQCSEKIATFPTIAQDIYKAYKRSKRVRLYQNNLVDRRNKRLVYVTSEGVVNSFQSDDLGSELNQPRVLYTRRKQNFCQEDDKGRFVNAGRQCELSDNLANACSRICCGFGYNTRTETMVEKYDCEFKWSETANSSGDIKCKEKRTDFTRYTCKNPAMMKLKARMAAESP